MSIVDTISSLADQTTQAGQNITNNVSGSGTGGSPEDYIKMIMEVGQYSASVSALSGTASAMSGALQGAASKVGS
jgi:hypothetical protein